MRRRSLAGFVAALCTAGVLAAPAAHASDTTPPAAVTAVSADAAGRTTLTLHWANPGDGEYAGVTIRRAVGTTAPQDAQSGQAVADVATPGTSFVDTGLAPGVTYAYALFAHDAIPNYATAATVTASTQSLTFTTSTPAPSRGDPRAVSCHRIFCMLVDASGQWQRFNGSTWTAPAQLFDPSGPDSGFTGISCPAIAYCMAVTGAGDAYTWNGTSWSAPTHVTSSLGSVSCPAANACWALPGGHFAYKLAGGVWTKQLVEGLSGVGVSAIACATTTMCAAVGNRNTGGAYAWHWVAGGPWSGPTALFHAGGDEIWNVSCSAANNCLAVGDGTYFSHFDGTNWSTGRQANPYNGVDLHRVSCASATFCAADGGSTDFAAMEWNGRSWSAPTTLTVDARWGPIGCISASMCVAANDLGQVHRWNGTRWSLPSLVDHTSGDLFSVACPLKTSCIALDGYGNVYGFDGQTWGSPQLVGGDQLACPVTNFCLTYSPNDGRVRQHVGTSWPVIATLYPAPYVLSCAGPTFCLGISGATSPPTTVKLSGSQWVYERNVPLSDIVGVSCPGRFWCMAVDRNGRSATYDRGHSRWTLGPKLSSAVSPQVQSVSCFSTTFCLAVLLNSMVRYDGSTWSLVGSSRPGDTSACVSTSVCLIADGMSYSTYASGGTVAGMPFPGGANIWTMTCQDPAEPFCVGVGFDKAVVGN